MSYCISPSQMMVQHPGGGMSLTAERGNVHFEQHEFVRPVSRVVCWTIGCSRPKLKDRTGLGESAHNAYKKPFPRCS